MSFQDNYQRMEQLLGPHAPRFTEFDLGLRLQISCDDSNLYVAKSLIGIVSGRMTLRNAEASTNDPPNREDKILLLAAANFTLSGNIDFNFVMGPASSGICDGG